MLYLVQGPSTLEALVVLSPLYSELPFGKAVFQIQNNTNTSLVQALQLGSLLGLAAVGQPGNSVCEVGELPGLTGPGEISSDKSPRAGSLVSRSISLSATAKCEDVSSGLK